MATENEVRASPKVGDRWAGVFAVPDFPPLYPVWEWVGECGLAPARYVKIAEFTRQDDAELLAHGRADLEWLRGVVERADEIISATANVDVAGKAWAESVDEWREEAQAALAANRPTT